MLCKPGRCPCMQFLGDVPLAPGEETSAEYAIFFPRQLPAREFILKVNLIYSLGSQYQQKMFFNETINVIEEPTLFDTQLIGLYLIGLAALAGIGACRHLPAGLSRTLVGLPPACQTSARELLRAVFPQRCFAWWKRCGLLFIACMPSSHVFGYLALPAVYSGTEFAKSKGWIKKSKPVVRPGVYLLHLHDVACLPLVTPLCCTSKSPLAPAPACTAATSSNKEEWLRGTAADPKLRKKQT